jgi:transcriptional regulator of aromatic amino acid metabolism
MFSPTFSSTFQAESIRSLLVEIDRMVEKLFLGVFSTKIPPLLPRINDIRVLMFRHFSTCQAEAIGMLLPKIR